MTTTGSAADTTPPIATEAKRGPGCLIQILWFLFVGWWLGAILIVIAWLMNVSIIGLPLGIAILNNIPRTLALQEPKVLLQTVERNGRTVIVESELPQPNFWLRAIYFVLVGWWWSGVWLLLAYVFCATIILMPVGLGMFRLTPAMTTLRRY
jgi:uncharacterized membrane protein YccF (DUF307 family)